MREIPRGKTAESIRNKYSGRRCSLSSLLGILTLGLAWPDLYKSPHCPLFFLLPPPRLQPTRLQSQIVHKLFLSLDLSLSRILCLPSYFRLFQLLSPDLLQFLINRNWGWFSLLTQSLYCKFKIWIDLINYRKKSGIWFAHSLLISNKILGFRRRKKG